MWDSERGGAGAQTTRGHAPRSFPLCTNTRAPTRARSLTAPNFKAVPEEPLWPPDVLLPEDLLILLRRPRIVPRGHGVCSWEGLRSTTTRLRLALAGRGRGEPGGGCRARADTRSSASRVCAPLPAAPRAQGAETFLSTRNPAGQAACESLNFHLSFSSHPRRTEKFPGQGSNPNCSCDQHHSCSNPGSLTHCVGPGIRPARPQRQADSLTSCNAAGPLGDVTCDRFYGISERLSKVNIQLSIHSSLRRKSDTHTKL